VGDLDLKSISAIFHELLVPKLGVRYLSLSFAAKRFKKMILREAYLGRKRRIYSMKNMATLALLLMISGNLLAGGSMTGGTSPVARIGGSQGGGTPPSIAFFGRSSGGGTPPSIVLLSGSSTSGGTPPLALASGMSGGTPPSAFLVAGLLMVVQELRIEAPEGKSE
jgi:hypothetical protein